MCVGFCGLFFLLVVVLCLFFFFVCVVFGVFSLVLCLWFFFNYYFKFFICVLSFGDLGAGFQLFLLPSSEGGRARVAFLLIL